MTFESLKKLRRLVCKTLLENKTLQHLTKIFSKFSENSNCRVDFLSNPSGLNLGHFGIFDTFFPFLTFFKFLAIKRFS